MNTRTGQVLPLYPDVLDDVAANKEGPLDIHQAAALLERPWLLIHGTGDTSVSVTEADRLARAARPPGFRKILLEGASHTFGAAHPWKGSTPELDTAISETVGWFSRHLS